MSYADINTPVIERITLPSGNSYYIADREIRNVVDALEDIVAGGVSFIIAWDGNSTPVPANIPEGVAVTYNNTVYVGTLSAETSGSGTHAQAGAFYLVKSSTRQNVEISVNSSQFTATVTASTFGSATNYVTDKTFLFTRDVGNNNWLLNGQTVSLATYGIITSPLAASPSTKDTITVISPSSYKDVYDEYVSIGSDGSKTWEKIGDTLVDLTNVVTDVSLNKTTTQVVGDAATVSVSQQPVVTLSSGGNTGITVATGTVTATNQPTIKLEGKDSNATGRASYIASVTSTKLSASASGGDVDLGTNDLVNALTSASPTENASSVGHSVEYTKSVGTTKLKASASVDGKTGSAVSSVAVTKQKLATGSVYGVKSGSNSTTTASKAVAATAQTTATGSYTVVNPTNPANTTDANSNSVYDPDECILVWPNVTNGTLVLRAATLDTQTTPQYTFDNVTVPIRADSATTVATGSVTTTGSGADVVTDVAVGDTVTVVTAAPTVTLSTGSTGDVTVATGGTQKYLSITTATDSVLGADTTVTVTQPTVSLATGDSGTTILTGGTTKYMEGKAEDGSVTLGTTKIDVSRTTDAAVSFDKDLTNVLSDVEVNVTKGA